MYSNRPISRRTFIRQATATTLAAPCALPSSVLGLDGAEPPSERIALGCVGVGMRGMYNMRRLINFGAEVVAVCDVKSKFRERARAVAGIPSSAAYNDFRDLLARDDLDAVMIAPPDHWHAIIAIEAARAGKDIYLQLGNPPSRHRSMGYGNRPYGSCGDSRDRHLPSTRQFL
jgi:hypothetical protein